MNALKLVPVDTFFFCNHKQLSPGENAFGSSIFPPRPSTIYGALRSAYIHYYSDFEQFYHHEDSPVRKWMGTPKEHGEFSIQGIFLHDGKELLLPLPSDHQVVKTDEQLYAYPLHLQKDEAFSSTKNDFYLYGSRDEKSRSSDGLYVKFSDWKKSLLHAKGCIQPIGMEQILVQEPKIGIGINRQLQRAEEGMLYQISMARFKENEDGTQVGIVVIPQSAPDFSKIRWIRLGGENRPWNVSEISVPSSFFTKREKAKIVNQLKQSRIARIILLTPAIWEKGNRPAMYDEATDELHLSQNLSVKLLTVAVSRPMTIGGWDLYRNRPKKRMYAVPAGTVLYVHVQPKQAELFVNTVMTTNFSDHLQHEGYGMAVCSSYQEKRSVN